MFRLCFVSGVFHLGKSFYLERVCSFHKIGETSNRIVGCQSFRVKSIWSKLMKSVRKTSVPKCTAWLMLYLSLYALASHCVHHLVNQLCLWRWIRMYTCSWHHLIIWCFPAVQEFLSAPRARSEARDATENENNTQDHTTTTSRHPTSQPCCTAYYGCQLWYSLIAPLLCELIWITINRHYNTWLMY